MSGRSNRSFRTLRQQDGKRKDLKKQKFGKGRKERAKGDEGGEAKGSRVQGHERQSTDSGLCPKDKRSTEGF